ncbi:MAG TPA: SCO1664 family protein [Acidimicrobiia bacterium]|nr:SCO1664 family protein [Acidimicrobiia bacterium]
MEVEGRMPYASNTTLLARDATGGLWVYKPERGENPLWDFAWRTLAAREVLTYEVATGLGLDLVPETILADGPFGPGSAQRFVEEDFDFDPRPLFIPHLDQRLWPVAVLDIVCNNADRKIGHVIRDKKTDRLWAIDHGLTFHADPKLRTVLWGFAGEPIPEPLLEALSGLRARLTAGLATRVAELLSEEEAASLSARVEELISSPVHPHPPDDRPAVPWPLV